ncbi:MAG TPA: helix-turn-helix domain-containing protein [Candidatus Saccharimonadales bacterium]|nr:helix-turn-helix domain-containing protein [Candidatus Saccharimonadales bacterium]
MDTPEDTSAAVAFGRKVRQARKAKGWTIAELADKLGRPREWLNRLELGYSEYGEYKPASPADIHMLADCLGDYLDITVEELLDMGAEAQRDFDAVKLHGHTGRRTPFGKLTQTEVIIGERQIVQAIVDLIEEQHSDAIIRNTGIKSPGTYLSVTEDWKNYRVALGKFLSENPNALFKRVEYAACSEQLQEAKAADEKLAGAREYKAVHNAKLRFRKDNPLQLHVIIGQREAILALPQTSGLAGSNIALLIRDKVFVEALRIWYDEVLWDAPGESKTVDFTRFEETFESIKQMYGYDKP